MIENKKNPFLKLEVVWKDEEMLELRVTAFNGQFYGNTKVYDQPINLLEFAKSLTGYPQNGQTLFYETGQKEGYAYFSMRYYPIDSWGHVGVEICMEGNTPTQYRCEEKSKLKLEIVVEPNGIDSFQKELFRLIKNTEGEAILQGRGEENDA